MVWSNSEFTLAQLNQGQPSHNVHEFYEFKNIFFNIQWAICVVNQILIDVKGKDPNTTVKQNIMKWQQNAKFSCEMS